MTDQRRNDRGNSVLVVDDDENILVALNLLLKSEGMLCTMCRSPTEAVARAKDEPFQMALVDLNYIADTTSGQEGLALIAALRELDEDLPIVAITGWATVGIAVEAMRRGAADFIEKPWDNHRLLSIVKTQLDLRAAKKRAKRLSAENELLRGEHGDESTICESAGMKQLLSIAKRVAASSIPILITGENGTGKGVLANYIHRHSPHASGPFISVNMGAIPDAAFESELFGHTKGAYTDAKTERMGRVELADQGTLFLDEIANLPMAQQAKILRLLEERTFEKLGSSQTRQATVRFVSATNAKLRDMVAEGRFRQDLLYRLNGVTLNVPPLRERQADILPLAKRFLDSARKRYEFPERVMSPGAASALLTHSWPGNIRELQHVVERSALLAQEGVITEEDLHLGSERASVEPFAIPESAISEPATLGSMTLDEVEAWFIRNALERHGGNATDAAKALGISRSALYRRLGNRDRN